MLKVVVIVTVAMLTAACVQRGEGGGDTARSDRLDTARTDTASTSSTDDCVRGEPEPVLLSTASRPAPRFERTGKLEAKEAAQIDDMIKALETAAAKDERYAYGEPIAVPEFTTVTCLVRTTAPDTVVVEVIYDVAL